MLITLYCVCLNRDAKLRNFCYEDNFWGLKRLMPLSITLYFFLTAHNSIFRIRAKAHKITHKLFPVR